MRFPWTTKDRPELIDRKPAEPKDHKEWMRHGQAAAELLNNALFQESLTAVRNDLNAQLMAVSLHDVEAHTRLVIAMQVTRAVERHLISIVETGRAAVAELDLSGSRID